ncbi:MRCE1 [Auxenochlorella protothecoides x Auxenochlorella symbiontica]
MKRGLDGPAGPSKLARPEEVEDSAEARRQPDDIADEELGDYGIPSGWKQCPAQGQPISRFIPSKVPLGAHFDDYIPAAQRYNVDQAQERADAKGAALQARCATVIDLTRSTRYYDVRRWQELGVRYIKIPCRGRGQVPQPEAVNDFVWEVASQRAGQSTVLVHCTHGFNRTGYMIVSYCVRMHHWTVEKALHAFALSRPPGIYKHYYIRQLYRYYHEAVPAAAVMPALPDWKAGDAPDSGDEGGEGENGAEAPSEHMEHDDVLGEEVSPAEAATVCGSIVEMIAGPGQDHRRAWFPGSQPVSLDRSNLELLRQRRYWVTWKADGTRYMLVILPSGTYLVDRKLATRRVQMRWPLPAKPQAGVPQKAPVGPPHSLTILDGEMIVDDDLLSDRKQRRFLAYDLMALNGKSVVGLPWKERYDMIKRYVMDPRKLERHVIETKQWSFPYQYGEELFHVRRKEFWPLTQADKLLHDFIPNQVSHESDGLILQGYEDAYVPGTCQELLKWKFAHLNSVDFRLRWDPKTSTAGLELLETRAGGARPRGYHLLPGATIAFPGGEDPAALHQRIVEAAYDAEAGSWVYMRERRDKPTPNAYHVYESVARSIQDNIQEEELLESIAAALQLPLYERDRARQAAGVRAA